MCPYISVPDYRFTNDWVLFNRFYDPYESRKEYLYLDQEVPNGSGNDENEDPELRDFYIHWAWYKYDPTISYETYLDYNLAESAWGVSASMQCIAFDQGIMYVTSTNLCKACDEMEYLAGDYDGCNEGS